MSSLSQPVFDSLHFNAAPTVPDFGNAFDQADVPPDRELLERNGLRLLVDFAAQRWHVADTGLNCDQFLRSRWNRAAQSINAEFRRLRELPRQGLKPTLAGQILLDHSSAVRIALDASGEAIEAARKLPNISVSSDRHVEPRPYTIAGVYLRTAGYSFDLRTFTDFVVAAQKKTALSMSEVWSLQVFLQFRLLEQIGSSVSECAAGDGWTAHSKTVVEKTRVARRLSLLLGSLQQVGDLDWKKVFEQLNRTDEILRRDPVDAYSRMDFDSREIYRAAVSELANSSGWSEPQIAAKAVELAEAGARAGRPDERTTERRSHVGYYLLDDGRTELESAVRSRYSHSLFSPVRKFLLANPGILYFLAIAGGAFCGMELLGQFLHFQPLSFPTALVLMLLLDRVVAVVNLLVPMVVPPKRIPKLDFSAGIPADSTSMVAIPALLLSEAQTRRMVRDLEVRYLANRDSNLHFALLTDVPDSSTPRDEKDRLAPLCGQLIQDLNEKYAADQKGSFFLLHRDRTYNPSEGKWMGWERKRGKLLEFNNLLLRRADNFSLKVGDLSLLRKVRYVITLDLDTQLPRGAAHRLIGAMAHPLNRAVIDPATNTVTRGHGILQPRVNISMDSAHRSRLAALFSGDTGLDPYTRAVSDVYQDLFGEGTFAGKGVYEVSVFQQVLQRRFPCNAILSHDLIEGAFARAGLLSDVEVVDEYPSHLNAFTRRKHRWMRGDWQILPWLFAHVRNVEGRLVSNPLSLLSRWKIVDNLRRSLSECGIFLLFLYGWFGPSANPLWWTLATFALLALPGYLRIIISILRASGEKYNASFWKQIRSDFLSANATLVFRIAFLCYETLVSLDAIVRTVVRLGFTRKRLLEWETAAETELGSGKKHAVDNYLDVSVGFALALWFIITAFTPASMFAAAPFALLWVGAKPIGQWLNRSNRRRPALAAKDRDMLRDAALRTWRFFRVHSNEHEKWLIPDVVQADPATIGHRISTTDLGLLLNGRLAAYDLGFLTMTEFIEHTEKSFESMAKLAKFKGHLYNWYDTRTLEPMRPLFISTVDNGNLLCSFWALKQGCVDMRKTPLFRRNLWEGIEAHVALIKEAVVEETGNQQIIATLARVRGQVTRLLSHPEPLESGLVSALRSEIERLQNAVSHCSVSDEITWWVKELSARMTTLWHMVKGFAPWTLPEFSKVREFTGISNLIYLGGMTLESAPDRLREMDGMLLAVLQKDNAAADLKNDISVLRTELAASTRLYRRTVDRLSAMETRADVLAKEMDFSLFYNPAKQLLAIGYDGEKQEISPYHYDLLASEARAATFGGIAKGDIPQDGWLKMERPLAACNGEPILMSWSGTMFEYLMPLIWMRSYPNTLLDMAARAAIRVQQEFMDGETAPWGISESACGRLSNDGEYIYHAFGVPALALNRDDHTGDVVISPYSSFLACLVDSTSAVRNIARMKSLGWLGAYGFYDAVDYTPSRAGSGPFKVVPTWMAHHQGMSLISAAAVLCGFPMQRRFHAEPAVAATERLLHEKSPTICITKPVLTSKRSSEAAGDMCFPVPAAPYEDANVGDLEAVAPLPLGICWKAWPKMRSADAFAQHTTMPGNETHAGLFSCTGRAESS